MSTFPIWLPIVLILCIATLSLWYIRNQHLAPLRRFATLHGLVYQPARMDASFVLHGLYQNRTIRVVSTLPQRRNASSQTWIRLALLGAPPQFQLFISPGISLCQNLTEARILSDDAALDTKYEFYGQPSELIKTILQKDEIRIFLSRDSKQIIFERLEINENHLGLRGSYFIETPAELTDCLDQLYEFATLIETIVSTTPHPPISTNRHE